MALVRGIVVRGAAPSRIMFTEVCGVRRNERRQSGDSSTWPARGTRETQTTGNPQNCEQLIATTAAV